MCCKLFCLKNQRQGVGERKKPQTPARDNLLERAVEVTVTYLLENPPQTGLHLLHKLGSLLQHLTIQPPPAWQGAPPALHLRHRGGNPCVCPILALLADRQQPPYLMLRGEITLQCLRKSCLL